MKTLVIVFFTLAYASVSFAAPSDLDPIHVAKAVKAIMDKGESIPSVIDVQQVEQETSPPESCVLVVYDRKPNTLCPGEFGMGPYLDKGYAACFNPTTNEVDSVTGVESQCPPSPRSSRSTRPAATAPLTAETRSKA